MQQQVFIPCHHFLSTMKILYDRVLPLWYAWFSPGSTHGLNTVKLSPQTRPLNCFVRYVVINTLLHLTISKLYLRLIL